MSDKTNYACVKTDDGRTTVYIRNKYILQKHENFRFIPDYTDVNDAGQKKPEAVYLSFFYRVAKSGRLTINFECLDKTGFENFNEFSYDGELEVTDGYQIFNHSGLWNGTGDFKLSFTGEIYLYMLVLSTDRAEALAYKYKTLFEQSEKLVKIAAANFDKEGNVIDSSSIITTAKYNKLMSQYFDENGQLVNKAGLVTTSNFAELFAQGVTDKGLVKISDIKAFVTKDEVGEMISGISISADQIKLEGLVTANENFKILEDGSIETNNAKLKGYLYSVFKPIEASDAILVSENIGVYGNYEYKLQSNLYVDATFSGVVLPVSEAYEGARVVIMDSYFVKTRTIHSPTTVRTENGSKIISGLFAQKPTSAEFLADVLKLDAGVVELILKNSYIRDDETGEISNGGLAWVLINNTCQNLYWEYNGKSYAYRYNLSS